LGEETSKLQWLIPTQKKKNQLQNEILKVKEKNERRREMEILTDETVTFSG